MTANELAFHNWQYGLDWDYSEPTKQDTQLNLFEMKDIKQDFLDYIKELQISQADKNLIKGVWYAFLSDNPEAIVSVDKKVYANYKLDQAAEVVMVNITTAYSQSRDMDTKSFKKHTDSFPGCVKTVWVNTESILALKDDI